MTDSAAVVSLFTDMAKTTLGGLSMKEQFSYLNKILKEVATDDEKTLETIVHKLDVLFNGKGVKRITTGDRDKLFEHIEAVRTAIAGKEDYQKLTVHDISVYAGSAEALAAAAKDSLAVRYALEELNPFVVLGVDYSQHNQNGELDLYDANTAPNGMSEQYLTDRASFLVAAVQAGVENAMIEIGRASLGKECRSRWSPYH